MGRTFAALLAAAAVLLLTAATPAMAKSSTSRCQDVTAIGNAFVARGVQAHSTPCKNVRGKLRGWLRKGSESLPKKARGSWRCKRVAGGKWSCVKRRGKGGVTFKVARERVAPKVSLVTPAQGAIYEQGASVAASYSCWDNAGIKSCVGTVPNGSRIPTSRLGTQSFYVTATDTSGNRTTQQVTYTVKSRTASPPPSGGNPPPPAGDTQGPNISVGSPTAGQELAWNATANAGYSCADQSGVAECNGSVSSVPVADGTRLPTSGAPGPGTRTLTITAKDKLGNASTKSVAYTVKPAGYYALTYDDGPNADFTQPVLNALASVNAKATFFVVGGQIQGLNQLGTQLVQAMVAGGHSVQNHTWSHANIGPVDQGDPTTPLPVDAATRLKELTDTSTLIKSITGVAPTFVRPPYGMWDQGTVDAAHSLTAPLAPMEVTAWTTDTNDFTGNTAAQVADAAMAVPLGGIILMHDAHQNTVDATPLIVNRLRDERGMLPGKLAPTTTPQQIDGWPDAGTYYVNAVAP